MGEFCIDFSCKKCKIFSRLITEICPPEIRQEPSVKSHNNDLIFPIICQDAFNGLETVEHLKLDFLNLLNLVSYTFRGLFNCKKLTIDNSDLGTVQPKAMSGMLGVQELNIINSKIDRIHENVISEESQVRWSAIKHNPRYDVQVKSVRLEGNHLLAIPDDFDYMVCVEKLIY